jgi:iron complex outermembrane receptor protein
MKQKISLIGALLIAANLSAQDLFDDSLEDILEMESEIKAEVGSRDGSKNFLESRSPVDVITSEQISSSGLNSLSDILRYFIAGFNAPETSIADGSDHVRAFTLRGMSPDQALVLLNGKRVHTSALLHVNGTIGRGSSNVDLDTIAPSSIERVEILRDGAAAQYGSDAIAGVINIILKGAYQESRLSVHAGERLEQDGFLSSADLFVATPLKYDGFLNVALQAKKQEKTDRAGLDNRLTPPALTTHVGIPESQNFVSAINLEMPQEGGLDIYATVLTSYRDSKASAFFRPSNHDENTTLLYADGFLPMLGAKIFDASFGVGVKGEAGGVEYDLSNTYGLSRVDYRLENSMNYSLGAASPTSFDAGSLGFTQNMTNLDFKKSHNSLNLAAGVEYRYESYSIGAGEEASYVDGGSQGFPGYSKESEVDASRNSYALYLDSVYAYSDFSLEGALRYENYSDFGSTNNIKVASDYKLSQKVFLRASVSTGFRAPSLSQSNYSNIATFGGVVSGTFQPDAQVSKVLGAQDLKAERSRHFTIGSVYEPTNKTSLMIDYFLTDVKDRIMLSSAQELTLEQQEEFGAQEASFFTNAVDTRTYGIDLKVSHKHSFENDTTLTLSAWYNYSKNRVTSFNNSFYTRESSFEQIDRMENGQPKHSFRFLTNYQTSKIDYTLNFSAFSSYAQVIDDKRYWFEGELLTDIDVSYKFSEKFNVALGGNNIFNSTPNRWDGLAYSESNPYYGYDAIKPYSRYSPFGYSGAYYYARATLKF